MSTIDTIKAAYTAFGRNDPSVLFGAMDSAISWNEAEGNPLADRNPYVGPQAIGEGVFGRLMAAIDNFTAVPSTFIDGGDHIVVLGACPSNGNDLQKFRAGHDPNSPGGYRLLRFSEAI